MFEQILRTEPVTNHASKLALVNPETHRKARFLKGFFLPFIAHTRMQLENKKPTFKRRIRCTSSSSLATDLLNGGVNKFMQRKFSADAEQRSIHGNNNVLASAHMAMIEPAKT